MPNLENNKDQPDNTDYYRELIREGTLFFKPAAKSTAQTTDDIIMVNRFVELLSKDEEADISSAKQKESTSITKSITVAQRAYIKQKLKNYTAIQSNRLTDVDEFNDAHSIYPRQIPNKIEKEVFESFQPKPEETDFFSTAVNLQAIVGAELSLPQVEARNRTEDVTDDSKYQVLSFNQDYDQF